MTSRVGIPFNAALSVSASDKSSFMLVPFRVENSFFLRVTCVRNWSAHNISVSTSGDRPGALALVCVDFLEFIYDVYCRNALENTENQARHVEEINV